MHTSYPGNGPVEQVPTVPWRDLDEELDRWRDDGRQATLWWRDDDATDRTQALERLFKVARPTGVDIGLAVIPAAAGDNLGRELRGRDRVTVWQHGYAHVNHLAGSGKAVECGGSANRERLLADLAAGRERLEGLFGERFRAVLVPPWNRIDEDVVGRLGESGFHGLSLFGRRPGPLAAPGVAYVNSHCDVLRWKEKPARFTGTAKAVGQIVEHLAARRAGTADANEATGLLTHHLAHDEAAWDFLGEFVARTRAHPAVRWVGAADVAAG